MELVTTRSTGTGRTSRRSVRIASRMAEHFRVSFGRWLEKKYEPSKP